MGGKRLKGPPCVSGGCLVTQVLLCGLGSGQRGLLHVNQAVEKGSHHVVTSRCRGKV